MCAKSLAHRKIVSEIEANGPLTFARFMELALYDREAGYYASGRARIGKHGDFFTNVSVGPVFGEILASQFREMWSRLASPRASPWLSRVRTMGNSPRTFFARWRGEILESS